jgi:peptide/nickel transport system substrate-binding protein
MLACAIFIAPAVGADELPAMGMVGLTRDQLARVSLFHDADVAGSICPSIVEIVAANGKVLASSKAELMPGTGAFFDYDLTQDLKKGERRYADLQLMGYPSAGGPDPEWLLSRFTSWEVPQRHNKWQGQNAPRWRNEDYDRLFHAAQSEVDPAKRAALFIWLNDQLVQGGAVIALTWYADVAAIASSLHGVEWSGWDLMFWRLPYWFRQG